ncbi:MAG: ParA family protein [Niveispirillum sp.]|uniref:ParA family protein n=1 Tax=Niveispirillum sp. TaxID=1917217 RepID=UPI0040350327
MSKRLVVFNHKGGVSKTTSAYNIGWMLSSTMRVLLVDADPQCNLSGLILRDDFERHYLEDATKLNNLKDGVAATFTGRPSPITAVDCVNVARAPGLYLLPGHANLSEYDAALTFAQTSNNALATLQNLPGAFAELLRLTEERYNIDVTIIDLNPGLSAINQNLFLISNAFIIPTNPDPFSLMALDTLKTVLPRWVAWKNSALPLFEESAYPLPAGTPKFIGTLIQRFNIRNGRAARPYRDNISEINAKVNGDVVAALRRAGMTLEPGEYVLNDTYCLGEIPDFQGLLPKSYDAGAPIFALTNEEIGETGTVLANFIDRRDTFYTQFNVISNNIRDMISHA